MGEAALKSHEKGPTHKEILKKSKGSPLLAAFRKKVTSGSPGSSSEKC